MRYEAEPYFRKRFQKKPPALQKAIEDTIRQLVADMSHPSLRVKRVRSADSVYEASIDTSNRLTFHLEGDLIVLRNHCSHSILERHPQAAPSERSRPNVHGDETCPHHE